MHYHQLAPERISALGYGEYRPVRPNSSIENRALNRRVDIVVLTMEMTEKEPSSEFYSGSERAQSFPASAENSSDVAVSPPVTP
jgi:hypothetical protein